MGASISDLDGDDEFGEAHEINVTPFIDVMLVLLIIFMIAAPLSTVDLPVDLPSSTATPQKKPDKPTYVTIKSDLAVGLDGRKSACRASYVHQVRPRGGTWWGGRAACRASFAASRPAKTRSSASIWSRRSTPRPTWARTA